MQFEVDPMDDTQENGEKPHFWLFCTLCTFFALLHIMHTYLIVRDLEPQPDLKKYLGLPSYKILSQSELPKSRKWQKNLFLLFFARFMHIVHT